MHLLAAALPLFAGCHAPPPVLLQREYVFTTAPFAQCHAATLAETPTGLVAAWFGGSHEGAADVGIWCARRDGDSWSPPVEVATGRAADGAPLPCWNPVLFAGDDGLLLFYKVGPNPSSWWGMLATSHDGGRTFAPAQGLPADLLGPIKNKPLRLHDGTLLCPSSREPGGWRVHFERLRQPNYEAGVDVADPLRAGAIQPTLLRHRDGRLQALCRSQRAGIVETFSSDGGATWTPLAPTGLPNPNSGIDAVTLADGRQLLVYNPTTTLAGAPGPRWPLAVALSDDGEHWRQVLVLEGGPGEFSYPAVIQTADGLVHVLYTHDRTRIAHAVIDPAAK